MGSQKDSYKSLRIDHNYIAADCSPRLPFGQRQSVKRGTKIRDRDGILRIVTGWAAQQSITGGAPRHLFSFLIPNDFLPESSAHYEVVALTDLVLLNFSGSANDDAQTFIEAAKGRLFVHAARLAAYGAYERIADLFLELHERLTAAGLAKGLRFPCPVGQDQIGNMMGLSAVHVNRTIAKLRADGLLLSGPGWYALPDPERLRQRIQTGSTAASYGEVFRGADRVGSAPT